MLLRSRQLVFGAALCLGAVLSALLPPAAGAQDPAQERELIGVLQSDAPPARKAMACKQLVFDGSPAAVPALAPLLADQELASWARIALEAIPGDEAEAALREAAGKLEGRLLIGTLNSLGERRDVEAVDLLRGKLQADDPDVASAAAVALGRVGGDVATKQLRESLRVGPAAVRSAVAEGCILCAERLWQEGRADEAAEVYEAVRQADLPKPRHLEATRGLILARQADGVGLLVQQLRSDDRQFFQLGLTVARELPAAEVTQALTAELAQTTPDRGSLLLLALADRGDRAALPAVLQIARTGPVAMRIAAFQSLRQLGDASCVPTLLEIALGDEGEVVPAAKDALAGLPGDDVNKELTGRLANAQGKSLPLLIELVGLRRVAASDELRQALDHADPAVRTAALGALGATAGPGELGLLIALATSPKQPGDQQAAWRALREAAIRMPDGEGCAEQLTAAMADSPVAAQVALVEILGAMGNARALAALGAAAKTGSPEVQDAASRLLGEWMTVDAGPVLLDLAGESGNKFNIRALRGYIRLARQFNMPDADRVNMCRAAWDAAQRPDERKLVLEVMERYPSGGMLALAESAASDAALKDEANRVAAAIRKKLGR